MIIHGDALNMPLADCSVDAIVTDPPYGLEFMGKEWDKLGKNWGSGKTKENKQIDSDDYNIKGRKINPISNNENLPRFSSQVSRDERLQMQLWHTQWLTEAYRVLKPGGSMLVMGGTRTFHRLMCAIEDAGFIIKDTLMWIYGSGFPKAQDLGKMIDKRMGAKREIVGIQFYADGKSRPNIQTTEGCHEGWKRPGHKENYSKENRNITAPSTDLAKYWDGFKIGGIKPAYEPIVWAVKPPEGSYVDNVLKWGVGAVNVDECRIKAKLSDPNMRLNSSRKISGVNLIKNSGIYGKWNPQPQPGIGSEWGTQGRFPANIILDEESAKVMDEQSGELGKSQERRQTGHKYDDKWATDFFGDNYHPGHGDSGGASRFFKIVEKECSLCQGVYTRDINKESDLWKHLFVNGAVKNSKITQAEKGNIALLGVLPRPSEQFVQNVKSAGSLCDKCGISIAHVLVAIKTSDSSQEELEAILDYMTNYERCILIQNLVNFAELWENIDTIPTIQSLSILFGSVQNAIRDSMPHRECDPIRFIYQPKASRSERNAGLDDLMIDGQRQEGKDEIEVKVNKHQNTRCANCGKFIRTDYGEKGCQCDNRIPGEKNRTHSRNHHPTVKPIALFEWLIKLVTREGQTVLDPFLGSGTTAISAHNTGRKCIGIEKEGEYIEITKRRTAYHESQPRQMEMRI